MEGTSKMKKIVIMLLGAVLAVNAGAESLPVLHVLSYTNSAITLIAEKSLNSTPVIMADQTGDLDGDGVQHVVYHDGTDLKSLVLSGLTLSQSFSRETPTPDLLVTGGRMRDTDTTDNVIWYENSTNASNLRAYIISAINGFSPFALRTIGTGTTGLGLGDMTDSYTGDEIGGYGNSYEYVWVDSGSTFSAAVYNNYAMYDNVNLMDFQHLNMSGNADEDSMIGFVGSGNWLRLWHGSSYTHQRNITVNPGAANEALFLQAGNVHSYSNSGPEEGVVYRKDGSYVAWTAKTDGSFTAPSLGNIGTGVTEMLIGDVSGDSLEEVVVSKSNLIEVWSLAAAAPSLLASYNVTGALQDFTLGDMNGDEKLDIIASLLVPPQGTHILIQ